MNYKNLINYCQEILEGKEKEQETLSEQEIASIIHQAKVRCLLEYKEDDFRREFDEPARAMDARTKPKKPKKPTIPTSNKKLRQNAETVKKINKGKARITKLKGKDTKSTSDRIALAKQERQDRLDKHR